MKDMGIAENKIIQYIQYDYEPEVILLAGSRVNGTAIENSDWDLFLLGAKKGRGGFFEFEGELLDITLKEWPPEDTFLTIPFGPLWPVRVLIGTSNERLTKLLQKTEAATKKGPLNLYKEACKERLDTLERWLLKIEKYKSYPEIQFLYAGIFYESMIRSWFEVRNIWPLPPREAIHFINQDHKDFGVFLSQFVKASGEEQCHIAHKILTKLKVPL